MRSTRLPGKVLADIAGTPALALQIRRIRRGALNVVVATSESPADDALEHLARSLGVPVVRGPEHDVLERFRLAADAVPGADPVIRLTADCPLTDPIVVHRALDVHVRTSADHTSNALVRTFPDGFDVEVVARGALLAAATEATLPDEREHVTPFLIRRPERFRLASICSGMQAGLVRMTIDTAEDLVALRRAVARASDPVTAAWHEFVDPPVLPTGISVWPRCSDGVFRERQFDVLRDGRPIGAATVTVEGGGGRLTLEVPKESVTETRSAIERWLTLDLQVVTLQ